MTPTIISLLAVTFGFIGLVLWVYWPSHKSRIEKLGRIPLDDKDLEDQETSTRRKHS